jgi:hypothetical protein
MSEVETCSKTLICMQNKNSNHSPCFPIYLTSQDANTGGSDFNVMIVAAGPLRGGGLVHAIAVTQPVQSWTVLRSYDDFKAVGVSLSATLSNLPSCPAPVEYDGAIDTIVEARNELQEWLNTILMYPGARESPDVRNFLTYGANMIPPQFEGVSWINFTQSNAAAQAQPQQANLDDMDMDEMFCADDEGATADEDEDDEDEFIPASVRYKLTDEAITSEDEMEIMNLGGEVEMVEDIGSLAQSLGASHLGRSLQLQAEMSTRNQPQAPPPENQAVGVRLGSPAPQPKGGPVGGLSNVMENAKAQTVEGLGDSFYQKRPVSAPRLDSFKMIKVVGKGSFGKFLS